MGHDAPPPPVTDATGAPPVVQIWARDGARTELSPGALDRLRLLRPGGRIELIHGDGRRDRWAVIGTVPHGEPAGADLILLDDAARTLTLVICGGAFRPDLEGYERPLRLHCRPDGAAIAA